MRILYHHRTRGKDVEGVHIREIVNALKKQGHKIYIISPPGVNPLNTVSFKPAGDKKISKIWDWISGYLPQLGFEILEICYNLIGYIKIIRAIKKHDINAIYERYAFFNWIGTFIAKRKGRPIIIEVNEVSGLKRVRGQVLVGLAKAIERRIFKAADAIVVVSPFLKRHIEKMGINDNKVHVIPNAVNLDNFYPEVGRIETRRKLGILNKIVLGFVGKLLPWNNLELLMDIFKVISEEVPNTHLLLVGDGQVKKSLEERVKRYRLEEKVTFTGQIGHKDVPKFIAAMDICIIPESNQYRSPVKLFEYMAMAKPVVAPRLEPIENVITNGENGVLFDLRNEDSLKKTIIGLIKDSEKRGKIGNRARETVIKNYTWENNAKKILVIYKSLNYC